jgi:pimeloyl-ACP methyl ester carboxylesterase
MLKKGNVMRLSGTQLTTWSQAKARLLIPIVYLRGFAMTGGEIEETSADPFNGFNIGSTLLRTAWTGDAARHVFESPVLRLSQPPYSYRVAFSDGIRGLDNDQKRELRDTAIAAQAAGPAGAPPPLAVLAIYRYYDAVSRVFGDGNRPGMETYGWGLGRLIVDVLDATGAPGVYLVAHSMGGLVARTFLQNETVLDGASPGTEERCSAVAALLAREPGLQIPQRDWTRARASVRRFFTYGTPHNGISGQGGFGNSLLGTVDALLGLEVSNFERKRMLEYLDEPPEPNSLGDRFNVRDTFCLVGTAASDYPAAAGFSRRLVGQLSDGLVEIDNAIVHGPDSSLPGGTALAARAYVRRAHSGPYGMVNSEEGFGNLSRFLFGDMRVDGDLLVQRIDLPPELQERKLEADKNHTDAGIRASYSFETALRVRGERWVMTERLARDGAAIFRRYDELFPQKSLAGELNDTDQIQKDRLRHRRLELFTAFLDTKLRTLDSNPDKVEGKLLPGTLGFALRLRVAVPDYEVEGSFWRRHHYEGSALLDRDLVFLAYEDPALPGGWGLAWGPNAADATNSQLRIIADTVATEPGPVTPSACRRNLPDAVEFWIPVNEAGPPAFSAWLRLTVRAWNAP